MNNELDEILRDLRRCESGRLVRVGFQLDSIRDVARIVDPPETAALNIVEHIDLAVQKLGAIKRELCRALEPDYVKEHRHEKLMTGNWENHGG